MKRISKGLLLSAAAGLAYASTAQAQFLIVNNLPGSFTDIGPPARS
jgi:hypothetical protein